MKSYDRAQFPVVEWCSPRCAVIGECENGSSVCGMEYTPKAVCIDCGEPLNDGRWSVYRVGSWRHEECWQAANDPVAR